MLYGLEYWAVDRIIEQSMNVVEMRILNEYGRGIHRIGTALIVDNKEERIYNLKYSQQSILLKDYDKNLLSFLVTPRSSGATRGVDSGSGPPPPLVRIIVY
jgi:hypothetical protein